MNSKLSVDTGLLHAYRRFKCGLPERHYVDAGHYRHAPRLDSSEVVLLLCKQEQTVPSLPNISVPSHFPLRRTIEC